MYERINWENGLAGGTPLDATNLNKGDLALSELMTGWISINATLTYASADAPTFVANTSEDLTGIISVGMKLKLTQTTVKYFIVTAITTTTITLYGGTEYALANATITLPYYSVVKAPYGFPTAPDKWSVIYSTNEDVAVSTAVVAGTWYNVGGSLAVPIGKWNLSYKVGIISTSTASQTNIRTFSALSTANNTASDKDLTVYIGTNGASATLQLIGFQQNSKMVTLASATTYYINLSSSIANLEVLKTFGSAMTTEIKAVCSYL